MSYSKVYTGHIVHALNDGRRMSWSAHASELHFAGPIARRRRSAAMDDDYTPGLAARLFVGLNVGNKQAHDVEDVVKAVERYRVTNGENTSASFVAQRGLYQPETGGHVVTENSVQIIFFDSAPTPRAQWDSEIIDLARSLRREFDQDSVIVEIQDAGQVVRVVNVDGKDA